MLNFCKFWAEDRCLRGTACTFAHSVEELWTEWPETGPGKSWLCKEFLRKGALVMNVNEHRDVVMVCGLVQAGGDGCVMLHHVVVIEQL